MKLVTLNYIHSLLKQEAEIRANAKKMAFEAWQNADKDGADNAPALWDLVEKARQSWREASNALLDFEAQEW